MSPKNPQEHKQVEHRWVKGWVKVNDCVVGRSHKASTKSNQQESTFVLFGGLARKG